MSISGLGNGNEISEKPFQIGGAGTMLKLRYFKKHSVGLRLIIINWPFLIFKGRFSAFSI